jgi:phosphoribosylformimino-5-aminoimidazole carboxamide ribotide isomerase
MPRVIPVIDVKGGHAVRAIGGDRANYQPLVPNSDPLAVARAFWQVTQCQEIYVADLDAITGGGQVSGAVRKLIAEAPCEVLLDAGTARWEPGLAEFRALPQVHLVLGSEIERTPAELAEICKNWPLARLLASLDLYEGELWRPHGGACNGVSIPGLLECWNALGIRRAIVLDLAIVGSASGLRTEPICRAIRETYPHWELITGGGVRSLGDIEQIQCVDAILIGTALQGYAESQYDQAVGMVSSAYD